MKFHFLLLLITASLTASSKSFRSLSSTEPVEINLISETEGYRDIHLLAISKSSDYPEIPLKLQYVINRDTLVDYIVLRENIRENIKSLFLFEGDSLQVLISIASSNTLELKVKGNLSLKEPMLSSVERSTVQRELPGSYWDIKHSLLFRIVKIDTVTEKLNFKIDFNENYNFNDFYFQVNIISPDSTFRSTIVQLNVNSELNLDFKTKSITTIQDFQLQSQGKYIIELVPFMSKRRVNGINSVGYELVM